MAVKEQRQINNENVLKIRDLRLWRRWLWSQPFGKQFVSYVHLRRTWFKVQKYYPEGGGSWFARNFCMYHIIWPHIPEDNNIYQKWCVSKLLIGVIPIDAFRIRKLQVQLEVYGVLENVQTQKVDMNIEKASRRLASNTFLRLCVTRNRSF
jgi:hypothetical protein